MIKLQSVKVGTFETINQAITKWFTSMGGNNIPINGSIILEKAREFADAFGCMDFQALNGWLQGREER